jgi:hypothetical protein
MRDGVVESESISGTGSVNKTMVADDVFRLRHVGNRFLEGEDAVMKDDTQPFIPARRDVRAERFEFVKQGRGPTS